MKKNFKSNPVVSVILPTYNRAELLSRAIKSVVEQIYYDWELIIWDDGSSDHTKQVVDTYDDMRIRYYFEINQGKSYALNQAIQRASGEYLAFLDDDDQWLSGKLERQMNALSQNPEIDLIFGDFKNINLQKGTEGVGFDQNARGLSKLETRELGGKCFLIEAGWLRGISTVNFIAFDTVLMKKDVYKTIGSFNENLKGSEDFEYWWRFGLGDFTAAYLDAVLLTRVKVPGSLSGGSLASIENQLKMLDACAGLSKKQDRLETVKYLRSKYRNAWQNKIIIYGKNGDRRKACYAFIRSLKHGFRFGSLKLMLKALG